MWVGQGVTAGLYPSSKGYSPTLGNPLINPVLFLLGSEEAVNNFRLSRKLDVLFVHLPAPHYLVICVQHCAGKLHTNDVPGSGTGQGLFRALPPL